jgi:hypothetical protein
VDLALHLWLTMLVDSISVSRRVPIIRFEIAMIFNQERFYSSGIIFLSRL